MILFYSRFIFVVFWLFLTSTVGTFYSLMRWGNLNIGRDFARFFSWGVLKVLGLHVEVEGREYLEACQPCIYVANHQSNLDIATFGVLYPRKTVVIGKKEVSWIPFFGLFYVAAGNVLIDRNKTSKAVAGLSQAVEAIQKKGVSIWIFPEGTRNLSGHGLLPFKRGAFHMAIQAGIPIVPIVSEPLSPFVNWKKKISRGGVFRIRVLPPIETKGMNKSDVEQLADHVRTRMSEALHGLMTSNSKPDAERSIESSSVNSFTSPNH